MRCTMAESSTEKNILKKADKSMLKKEDKNILKKAIILRKAQQEDLGPIIELQKKVFHFEQNIPADDIEGFLDRNPMCWCAVCDDKFVSAAAAWEENGVLHWGRFVTNSRYRGLHIGTQLARRCFDDLFSQGYTQIYMEAREVTVKMIVNMGGEITGETVPFFAGTVTPLILKKESYYKSAGL